ncbi:MAG: nitroreductase family protein [Oscillospiraceae bacterium]|nr:nitroreductase family protein [Oscillospiraceae bacterium]
MLHNETIDTILARESCLDFTGEPVPEEVIETLVTAAKYAPTSGGRQPWHITVITDPDVLDEISWLVYGNFLEMMETIKKESEKGGVKKTPFSGYDENPTAASVRYHAPMLVIVSGDPQKSSVYHTDCCLATENLYIAARSLGLGSLWWGALERGGFKNPKGKELRDRLVPEGYEVVSTSLIGYPTPGATRQPGRVVGFQRGAGGVTRI